MYTIYIEKQEIEAIIGILDFERVQTQLIVSDCTLSYQKRGDTFVDYAEVSLLIEEMLINQKFLLIEDALSAIISAIKVNFPIIKRIELKLSKPDILANCIVSVSKATVY